MSLTKRGCTGNFWPGATVVLGELSVFASNVQSTNSLRRLFAQIITSGTERGFHCTVFELCHSTLYDVVKGYCRLTPLPAMHVVEISYQLVQAIQCESPRCLSTGVWLTIRVFI